MGKEQYISLIAKQLGDELNTSELRELNGWLSGNSANADIKSDFQHIWESVSSYKAAESFDSSSAFEKFSKKYDLSESAPKIAPISVGASGQSASYFRKLAIAATAIALFLGGYFLSQKINPTFSNKTMAALPISLSQNASATLKPNTSLRYNSKKSKISSLNGGAYFNLANIDDSEPISFDVAKAAFTASNAKLNIENYEGQDIVADVEEGSVSVKVNNKEVLVKSGEKFILSKDNNSFTVMESNSSNAFSWSKGILSFDNTPLYQVFDDIEKFYGIEITVTDDSSLEDSHLTTAVNFKPKTLEECLDVVQTMIPMNISSPDGDRTKWEVSKIQETN